ncbi:Monocarboxylate transporter 7 [Trichostrongylus colubriformis]|uniref:Monocarboxylate transporter 7 n=1 Tax=Trichostrongylus colubriformis TaxID=6319 RepID=A0AAN8FE63_TRICO
MAAPSECRHIWLAFFGFYILFTENGVRQVMNVFVDAIIDEYNCTKTEADSAVIVAPTASSLMSGPLAAMFYQLAGARVSILSGALMCFIGFCLGSVAPSMAILGMFGVLIGFGCSLMRNAIISVQCEYFIAKRNTVMSFISIGPGIGIFLLPRVLVPLINTYSWKAGFQFLALLYVICGVMSLFITRRSTTQHHSFAHFTGLKVWFHFEFWFHAVASFCASAVCIIYLSNILSHMRGEGIEQPEIVYSYFGIASIIGRILLTLLLGFANIHIAIVMIFNYLIALPSIFSAAFCYTLWEFRLQNFFSGFGIGLFQATLAQFLLLMVGPSQLPGALGYTNLINGAAAFAAVHIAGSATQRYQSARVAFQISCVFGLFAIVFAIGNSAAILLRQRKEAALAVQKKAAEIPELRVMLHHKSED